MSGEVKSGGRTPLLRLSPKVIGHYLSGVEGLFQMNKM